MIGKSAKDYIIIRTSILALRFVAPASLGYLAASFYRREFLLSIWLGSYALAESALYLLVYLPRSYLMQKVTIKPPQPTYEERQLIFNRCKSYLDGEEYPTGWFLPRFSNINIKRENVVLWILWALFSTETYQSEWEDEINGYISDIESLLGRPLEVGYNDEAVCMRLTFDPVVSLHRPLVWYLTIGGLDFYSSIRMRNHGFKHYAAPGWFKSFPPRPQTILSKRSADPDLSYWYRPHNSTTKLPILFLHGIGIGLWPYLPFFADIVAQDPDVGILVIEFLPISSRITSPPLSSTASNAAISRILTSLQISRFSLVSNSYGTVIATQLLHDHADLSTRISSLLFIDPIPFLLHLPSVAYNFVYRAPRTANEWQLWYFASRDADVARALSRHFFWTENVLWKEELEGRRVGVVLSGVDQIVDAEEVRGYLTGVDAEEMTGFFEDGKEINRQWEKDGLEVLFYPSLDHAMVFDTFERRKPVLDIVHRFVQLE